MKTYGGVKVQLYALLTLELALEGDWWSISQLGRFTPGVRATLTHMAGDRVDAVIERKISASAGNRFPISDRPVRSLIIILIYCGPISDTLYIDMYRAAQKSVNWLVKCALKYVRNVFITYLIYKNCSK
jgi:hypothetical protein